MAGLLDYFKNFFNDRGQQEEVKKTNEVEHKEDTELIAAITAAISCYLESDTSNFYVKSIIRLPETAPVWAKVGRQEQMRARL
ncbi:hypothetical protein TKV_c21260 [Thermoanaerobacter kivui]|uniref:Sodium pump decarboxylase gamma subunit n=1 Tax=Thermoanaerobacter kivui TaxID=2325 RepID=A0A097ATW8_THEKI|nr:sodium pump decarboxylase subunit gamma [Thermoanaerobacter kivui]AIS53259.1 hypothetical protein TKV_c21260 [Thermoanaerobacter kivui]